MPETPFQRATTTSTARPRLRSSSRLPSRRSTRRRSSIGAPVRLVPNKQQTCTRAAVWHLVSIEEGHLNDSRCLALTTLQEIQIAGLIGDQWTDIVAAAYGAPQEEEMALVHHSRTNEPRRHILPSANLLRGQYVSLRLAGIQLHQGRRQYTRNAK